MMRPLFRGLLATAVLACLASATADGGELGHVARELPDPRDPMPLYLQMADEHIAELYARDVLSDERLPGQFRLAPDEPWQPLREASIRFRGTSSRHLPKKSLNVRFAEPQPFVFDTSRLNLNAMFTDPSMMREALSFAMFHALDLPASRTRYVDLYLDDVFEGLYLAIQRVDEELLAQHGLATDVFTLVRDDFRSAHVDLGAASMFSYDWSAETDVAGLLEANVDARGSPDWAALADLVQWVHATPAGPAFAQGFVERIDIERFVDWLAVHVLIGDIDAFADDYWLYRDGTDPDARWLFIPWDKDLSFGSYYVADHGGTANDFLHLEFTPADGWANGLIARFLATDSLEQLLHERLVELMDTTFTVAFFEQAVADLGPRIAASVARAPAPDAFVRHPQNHVGELGFFDQHTATLIDFVERRQQFLRRFVTPRAADAVRYTASLDAAGLGAGDVVFFTDAFGWTLARLDLSATPTAAATITVSLDQDDRFASVDRVWTVDVSAGTVAGSLTLYYRNNLRDGNWYRVDEPLTAIGAQRDLRVASVARDGSGDAVSIDLVDSVVNPYANAVSTATHLTLSGRQSFALVDRDLLR